MSEQMQRSCTAFGGTRLIAVGPLADVALKVKDVIDRGERASVLIFDNLTSEPIEVDFRGTADDVLQRLLETAGGEGQAISAETDKVLRGPGRPKLGVVAREVTLLPRHWDWLNRQPGGASVALRRLVEEARRLHAGRDRVRQSQESAYRFMSAMAGNLPGFEEAARALFAGRRERFDQLIDPWPADIRDHAKALASAALAGDQG